MTYQVQRSVINFFKASRRVLRRCLPMWSRKAHQLVAELGEDMLAEAVVVVLLLPSLLGVVVLMAEAGAEVEAEVVTVAQLMQLRWRLPLLQKLSRRLGEKSAKHGWSDMHQ